MSHFGQFRYKDSTDLDAFGRLRVSEPHTLFESKQIFDNSPLFWDESLESGAGITSSHSTDEAATTITSTLNTAGVFTRQTFRRLNYQPGKSMQVMLTGVLEESGGGTGVERRIGYFDDDNGLFFEDNAGTIGVTRRTNVTGTPVDNTVAQSSWNVDVMDGTGPSGITADFTKTQIFYIDFEWLGAGRVRMCLGIEGRVFVVHEFLNANILATVYMSTPNLPMRYQMITTGSSPASTMVAICGTVNSEGGQEELGVRRCKSNGTAFIEANTVGTFYALVGVRLKAANVGATINIETISVAELQGNNNYEWQLQFNPTVAGTFTYSDITNSSVQFALGDSSGNPSTNTVTGGIPIAGSYSASALKGGADKDAIENALRLGVSIGGTLDTIVLAVRPLTINCDCVGNIVWRELI